MIRAAFLTLTLTLALALPVRGWAQALVPEATVAHGPPGGAQVLVRGTTDIALFDPVLRAFSATAPGLRIVYEQWGSNDLYAAGVAACRGRFAPADLVISSAADLMVKLVNDGCAQPHRPAAGVALAPGSAWRGNRDVTSGG